jgi:hypothetical protein
VVAEAYDGGGYGRVTAAVGRGEPVAQHQKFNPSDNGRLVDLDGDNHLAV